VGRREVQVHVRVIGQEVVHQIGVVGLQVVDLCRRRHSWTYADPAITPTRVRHEGEAPVGLAFSEVNGPTRSA
jgi:hypothetical protein